MGRIKDYIEKFYPIVLSFFITIIFLFNHSIKILDDVNLVLGSVLTFVSIIIGFMGILITLIFGIQENSILNYILKDEYYKLLAFKYFPLASYRIIIIVLKAAFHTDKRIKEGVEKSFNEDEYNELRDKHQSRK